MANITNSPDDWTPSDLLLTSQGVLSANPGHPDSWVTNFRPSPGDGHGMPPALPDDELEDAAAFAAAVADPLDDVDPAKGDADDDDDQAIDPDCEPGEDPEA